MAIQASVVKFPLALFPVTKKNIKISTKQKCRCTGYVDRRQQPSCVFHHCLALFQLNTVAK